MASPKSFSMQGALDVDIFNLETDLIEASLEDCLTTTINVEATKVYTLGKGGAYLAGFSHSRRIPVTLQHGYPTSEILSIQSGQDIAIGVNNEVVKKDIVVVNSDASETTFTALGTAGEEIGVIYTLNSDGSFGEKFTQAGTAGAGTFSYTVGTKALAFEASAISDGTQIVMFYKYTTDATAQTIKFDSDIFAGDKKVVMTGLAVDNCSGKQYKAQLIFRKMSIMDGFTYTLEETGDPVVQDMNMEALAPCGTNTMMEWVIFDEDLAT